MMRVSRALQAVSMVAALFAAGCSGGDGGGGGNGGDPPIADAGDDAAARIHQTWTLNGSQSEDPEGKDLGFTWIVLSAPDGSAVTLTGGGAVAMPSFTPDAEGTYVFGLVVTDGKKTSALDTVEITVQLRIAVFSDGTGELASELSLSGAGVVDDHYGYPESYIAGASGDVLVMYDYTNRTPILVAYRGFDGSLEQLAAGELGTALVDGDWVAWREYRDGQFDLFARNLLTGATSQVTNTLQTEEIGDLAGGILTWEEERDPLYGIDVFASDLAAGSEIQISPPDVGVDEQQPRTDGETVVYSTFSAENDVYGYDISGQLLFPIATSTSNGEFTQGVSGDYVILTINTGAGATLVRHRISDGDRIEINPPGAGVHEVDGDYVLFSNSAGLHAHRLSTATTSMVSAEWQYTDIADGVVVWTQENLTTASSDVYTKTLPAGVSTQVTATAGSESQVAALSNGLAWAVPDSFGLLQASYSEDGGATVDVASGAPLLLKDRADEYDVAIISRSVYPMYSAATIEALSAAGVPLLAFEPYGDGNVAELYAAGTSYNLAVETADCGAASVDFGVTHPAFEGFASGSFVKLERELPVFYSASVFDVFAGPETPPSDWQVLASHGANPNTCSIGGETAIATFTNDDGTAVILDGVASEDTTLWLPARRALVLSELRYLASTRAP